MKNTRTCQGDSEKHHTKEKNQTKPKKSNFSVSSETRKVQESVGPIDEEVKEILDDEATSRKLDDLWAFLYPVEESRSLKRFPVPDILFMENKTYWKFCLYLNCQQSNL